MRAQGVDGSARVGLEERLRPSNASTRSLAVLPRTPRPLTAGLEEKIRIVLADPMPAFRSGYQKKVERWAQRNGRQVEFLLADSADEVQAYLQKGGVGIFLIGTVLPRVREEGRLGFKLGGPAVAIELAESLDPTTPVVFIEGGIGSFHTLLQAPGEEQNYRPRIEALFQRPHVKSVDVRNATQAFFDSTLDEFFPSSAAGLEEVTAKKVEQVLGKLQARVASLEGNRNKREQAWANDARRVASMLNSDFVFLKTMPSGNSMRDAEITQRLSQSLARANGLLERDGSSVAVSEGDSGESRRAQRNSVSDVDALEQVVGVLVRKQTAQQPDSEVVPFTLDDLYTPMRNLLGKTVDRADISSTVGNLIKSGKTVAGGTLGRGDHRGQYRWSKWTAPTSGPSTDISSAGLEESRNPVSILQGIFTSGQVSEERLRQAHWVNDAVFTSWKVGGWLISPDGSEGYALTEVTETFFSSYRIRLPQAGSEYEDYFGGSIESAKGYLKGFIYLPPAAGLEKKGLTANPVVEPLRKFGSAPYAVGVRVGGSNVSAGRVDVLGRVHAEMGTALPEVNWRRLPRVLEHLGLDPELADTYSEDDLNRAVLKLVPIPEQGKVLKEEEQRRADAIGEEVTRLIIDHAVEVIRNSGWPENVRIVHIGVPAPVDSERGIVGDVIPASNVPGYNRYPLADKVSQGIFDELKVRVPVVVENDAPSGYKGEQIAGAGKGFGRIASFIWGTGMNGTVYNGRWFELGHALYGEKGLDGKWHYQLHDVRQKGRPALGPGQQELEQRLGGGAGLPKHWLIPGGFSTPEEVTRKASIGDLKAIQLIRDAGAEFGRAVAVVFNEDYQEDGTILERFILVSGIGEHFGEGVLDEWGRDLLIGAIRDGAREELTSRFGISSTVAEEMVRAFVRSEWDARREIAAAAEGLLRQILAGPKDVILPGIPSAEVPFLLERIARERVIVSPPSFSDLSEGGTYRLRIQKVGSGISPDQVRVILSIEKGVEELRDSIPGTSYVVVTRPLTSLGEITTSADRISGIETRVTGEPEGFHLEDAAFRDSAFIPVYIHPMVADAGESWDNAAERHARIVALLSSEAGRGSRVSVEAGIFDFFRPDLLRLRAPESAGKTITAHEAVPVVRQALRGQRWGVINARDPEGVVPLHEVVVRIGEANLQVEVPGQTRRPTFQSIQPNDRLEVGPDGSITYFRTTKFDKVKRKLQEDPPATAGLEEKELAPEAASTEQKLLLAARAFLQELSELFPDANRGRRAIVEALGVLQQAVQRMQTQGFVADKAQEAARKMGSFLLEKRQAKGKGWTQLKVAQEAEITPAYITKLEKGSAFASQPVIIRLGRILDFDGEMFHRDYVVPAQYAAILKRLQTKVSRRALGSEPAQMTGRDLRLLNVAENLLKELSSVSPPAGSGHQAFEEALRFLSQAEKSSSDTAAPSAAGLEEQARAVAADEVIAQFHASVGVALRGLDATSMEVGTRGVVLMDIPGSLVVAAGLEQVKVPVVVVQSDPEARQAAARLLTGIPVVAGLEEARNVLAARGVQEPIVLTPAITRTANEAVVFLQGLRLLPQGNLQPLLDAGMEEGKYQKQFEQYQ